MLQQVYWNKYLLSQLGDFSSKRAAKIKAEPVQEGSVAGVLYLRSYRSNTRSARADHVFSLEMRCVGIESRLCKAPVVRLDGFLGSRYRKMRHDSGRRMKY